MYASNVFSERPPGAWAKRRRYFERVTEQTRTKAEKADKPRDASDPPKR